MNEKYTINISFFEKNLPQNTQLTRNLLQYNSLPYNKIQCFAVDSVDFSWFFSRARKSPCMRVREIVSLFEFIFPFWIHWWARRRGADLWQWLPQGHTGPGGSSFLPFFLSCLLFSTKLRAFKNILLFSVSFLVLFPVVRLYANGRHKTVKSANIC